MAWKIVDVAVVISDASPVPTLARIGRLPRVHLLDTAAWIRALTEEGIIADGPALIEAIDAPRHSPLKPFERPGRTARVRSRWLSRRGGTDHDAG